MTDLPAAPFPASATLAAPSSPGGTEQPSVRRSAAFAELAGLWLLVLVLGAGWLALSFGHLQRLQVQAMQQQRLSLTLAEIQEALEADLALGFDLVDDPNIPALLDRAIERDPALRAVDVAGRNGIALHSTDRGTVGEPLAAEVLAAARRPGATGVWPAQVAGEPVLGVALRGPFGETVGHAVIAYRPDEGRAAPVSALVLAASAAMALCAALLAWLLLRRRLREDAATPPLDHAFASTEAARLRFEAGLARIDENERAT